MLQIIRCGTGWSLVIAKENSSPPRYFRYADWKIGDHEIRKFHEIEPDLAQSYFSGQADGLGFCDDVPSDLFDSLAQLTDHIERKRREFFRP